MISYVKGDATRPEGVGTKVIVHCCNDLGAWGSGFVLAVSKRWPEPEAAYLDSITRGGLTLGNVQFVEVGDDYDGEDSIVVANLIGQKGLIGPVNPSPVRYSAIETGLERVARFAKKHSASIHMPRIGCGLAGGTWTRMEPIVSKTLKGLSVTVYDL